MNIFISFAGIIFLFLNRRLTFLVLLTFDLIQMGLFESYVIDTLTKTEESISPN